MHKVVAYELADGRLLLVSDRVLTRVVLPARHRSPPHSPFEADFLAEVYELHARELRVVAQQLREELERQDKRAGQA